MASDNPHPKARGILIAELDQADEIRNQVGSSELNVLLAQIGSLIVIFGRRFIENS